MRGVRNRIILDTAKERIDILMSEAHKAILNDDSTLARTYVYQARRISSKYRVRIPREHRYHVCKSCGAYLLPGKNAHVRIKNHRVVIQCTECGAFKRYPLR